MSLYHPNKLKNQNWSKLNPSQNHPKFNPNKSLLYKEENPLNFTLFLSFNPAQFLRFSF
jgi:hypothetical protein